MSPDVHRWHQVAELTLHPSLIPKDITSIYGSVQIETHPSIDDPVTLEIPYQATILHGSLDYDHQSTYFYISSSSSSKEKTEECRMIEFFNRFNVPITIFNVSTDQSDLLSLYLKVKLSSFDSVSSSTTLFPSILDQLLLTICAPRTGSISITALCNCDTTTIIIGYIYQF